MVGRALLLDLDGTVADSLGVMRRIYGEFLAAHGTAASDWEFNDLNGPPLREVVRRLQETHQLSGDLDSLYADYQRRIDTTYLQVSPRPGTRTLLETANSHGWKVAMVTSNSHHRTAAWLEVSDLADFFEVTICGEDIAHRKPHPEPYLLALERTKCAAYLSLAVEDSFIGGRAAIAAGISTFLLSDLCDRSPHGVLAITRLEEVTDYLLREYQERGAR